MERGIIVILGGVVALSLGLCISYASSYEGMYRQLESHKLELANLTTTLERTKARHAKEVEKLKQRSGRVPTAHPPVASAQTVEEAPKKSTKEQKESIPEERERATDMQVAALGKLLTLSEDEKADLEEMYEARQDDTAPFQSLEQILGDERAQFVREEQRKAFSRSDLEDLERNAYYFARKLSLTEDQELLVLNSLTEIQQRINDERVASPSGATPAERMQQILRETRLYRTLLMERMQKILTPSQIEQYAKYDQESTAADMELWHGGPEE